MSDTAIQIEGIGKKYLIRHNKQKGESYTALRDVLSEGAKKIINPKFWSSFKGEQEEFWAVKDINLEIKKGEKIGIIGKNGAGKSTLLKILSRITAPTEGRVQINGRVSSLLEVGTGFHPELTGRENIYLNGSILGMSHTEIKKQFDEIVGFSGVEQFLDTPVKRYSSGMKTRLGFAIAAHLENDILILDEVLAVGDAEFQKKCVQKVDQITQSHGKTIVFVSHNMGAVQQLCDTAALLKKGNMINYGSVDIVASEYLKSAIQSSVYKIRGGIDFVEALNLNDFSASFPYNLPEITLRFRNVTDKSLADVKFNIAVINQRDERILQLSSEEVHDPVFIKPGEFVIKAMINEPIALSPGLYRIDSHFYSPSLGNITISYSMVEFSVLREAFSEHKYRKLNMFAEPALIPKYQFEITQ